MEANGELLRLLACAGAAAVAFAGFARRGGAPEHSLRFAAALAVGALACQLGGAWLARGTLSIAAPGAETSVLFLPLGLLATAPLGRGARAYLAAAAPAFALGIATARLGCIAAACCYGARVVGTPGALLEVGGWLLIAHAAARLPRFATACLLVGGGALRLVLEPLRAANTSAHRQAAVLAMLWILCGLAGSLLPARLLTSCPARSR